eukprot:gnl/Hemi2/9086_TR3148_c0_g1_i1.p1 gnl/Hemi2/9086_TR3148_c0_g1~~gnl/Hemi2/9086_TR3148_c0_g1_i1.p1  ORF type:complete len:307 (+),score=35.21 gnl/Hemi2/9086_TR3148_c0_g1_i1:89-1009(+)
MARPGKEDSCLAVVGPSAQSTPNNIQPPLLLTTSPPPTLSTVLQQLEALTLSTRLCAARATFLSIARAPSPPPTPPPSVSSKKSPDRSPNGGKTKQVYMDALEKQNWPSVSLSPLSCQPPVPRSPDDARAAFKAAGAHSSTPYYKKAVALPMFVAKKGITRFGYDFTPCGQGSYADQTRSRLVELLSSIQPYSTAAPFRRLHSMFQSGEILPCEKMKARLYLCVTVADGRPWCYVGETTNGIITRWQGHNKLLVDDAVHSSQVAIIFPFAPRKELQHLTNKQAQGHYITNVFKTIYPRGLNENAWT